MVDRSVIAGRAFADPQERAWLERLLWPLVGARIAEWRAGLDDVRPRPVAAIVETPLLFEAGMQDAFDQTIAIVADEELRSARAGNVVTTPSTSAPPGSCRRTRRRRVRRT